MKTKGIQILTWNMILIMINLSLYVVKTDLLTAEMNIIISIPLGLLMGILGIFGISIFISFRKVGIQVSAKVDSIVSLYRSSSHISYTVNDREYSGVIITGTERIGDNVQITIFKDHPRFYASKLQNSWLVLFILVQLTVLGFLIGISSIILFFNIKS